MWQENSTINTSEYSLIRVSGMVLNRETKEQWIPLGEAAKGSPYSADYLRLLSRQRKILSRKIGDVWHTTREAVDNYKNGREASRSMLRQRDVDVSMSSGRSYENIGYFLKFDDEAKPKQESIENRAAGEKIPQSPFVKEAFAISLALVAVTGVSLQTLDNVSPQLAHSAREELASVSQDLLSPLDSLFSSLKKFFAASVPGTSILSQASNALPTATTSALTQASTPLDLNTLKFDLRSELESFVKVQIKDLTDPLVIYSSPQIVNTKILREEILLADTRPTITRQSSSDVDHVSRAITNVTTDGTLTNPTISGATITGSTFSGTTGTFTDLTVSGTCTGCGTPFPFTVQSYGVSTSTTLAFTQGFLSTASSTIDSTLLITGSTTLQNFTGVNSTTTNSTSTHLYFSGTLTGAGALTLNAQNELRFADSDSSNYVGFKSPSTVSSNLIWTLPSADASGCLKSNGAGLISIDSCSANAVAAGGLTNDFRGLYLRTGVDGTLTNGNATNTVVLIHADEIVTKDGARHTPADNLTADIRVSGIGGLKAGQTETASTWYKIMYAYGGSGEGIYLEQAKNYYLDQSQTGTDDQEFELREGATTNVKISQTFDTDFTGAVEFVDLKINQQGSVSGRIWIEVLATSGGVPTGSAIATSDKMDASLVSASNQIVRFVFRSPTTLTAGTPYAIALVGDYVPSGTVNIRVRKNSLGGYSSGQHYLYDGTNWTSPNAEDLWFKVYVTRNNNTPTPPSGYNTSYAHIGWVYNNASSNFNTFTQRDRLVHKEGNEFDLPAGISTLIDISTTIPPGPASVFGTVKNASASRMFIAPVPDGFYDTSEGNIKDTGPYGRFTVTHPGAVGVSDAGTSIGPVNTEYQGVYAGVNTGTGRFQLYGFEWSRSDIGTPAATSSSSIWLLNDLNDAYYNSGNIGVGTSTPWGKLSVKGTGTGTGIGFVFADSANAPKFTILDNGNVGVGTTTPGYKLSINSSNSTDNFLQVSSTTNQNIFSITSAGNIQLGTNALISRNTSDAGDNGTLTITGGGAADASRGGYIEITGNENAVAGKIRNFLGNAANAEYMVFRGDGSQALSIQGSNGSAAFTSNASGGEAWEFTNTHASDPFGIKVRYSAAAPNGTSNNFFLGQDSGTTRVQLRSNGGIANFQANDVNLSDATTKDIFGLAPSQLSLFSQIEFVEARYKDATTSPFDIMVTAQQVQGIYPDLITEFADGKLGVREHGLVMRGLKAIQELNLNLESIASTTASSTPQSESFASSFFENLFSRITTWLADAANGIVKFFAEEVHTKKLCVEDVCVTRDEFMKMVTASTGSVTITETLITDETSSTEETVATSTETTFSELEVVGDTASSTDQVVENQMETATTTEAVITETASSSSETTP